MLFHETVARLDALIEIGKKTLTTLEKFMSDFTALKAAVDANTAAVNKAVAALTSEESDQATINSLAATIAANNTSLNTATGGGSTSGAPVVAPIASQSITLPAVATLNAVVTPSSPAPTLAWTQTGGPVPVAFSSPFTASTTASFTTAGTYVLRVTATNPSGTSFAEVTVVAS